MLSGNADFARQILTAIGAAIITVVGVVSSITIVVLTLTCRATSIWCGALSRRYGRPAVMIRERSSVGWTGAH
ncbi:hypothetical protein ACFWYW_17330 [Nonomuraea sp. NPDC059023]|uniref:hypothetical protein n=1 Tax=unclassified Nonomuraea TaxID=2593643 RepID=UPI00369B42A8